MLAAAVFTAFPDRSDSGVEGSRGIHSSLQRKVERVPAQGPSTPMTQFRERKEAAAKVVCPDLLGRRGEAVGRCARIPRGLCDVPVECG